MTSSYSSLLCTLHNATNRTLRNADEVAALVEAAVQLSSSRYRPLTSPWDVPKLLSSALRTQLNRRMCSPAEAAASVGPVSLCRIWTAAWRLCPLVALPLPTAAAGDCTKPAHIASLLSLTDEDVERVKQEISSLDNVPSSDAGEPPVRCTAIAVVTSLLLYWHMLCGETQETTAEGEEAFRQVSATVWQCLQCWTVADGCDEVRHTLLKAWMSTVLRRALLCTSSLRVISTVTLLDTVVQPNMDATMSITFFPCSPSNSGLSELWARLHLRVCQHVLEDMRARQAAFIAEWSRCVTPVLTHAFVQEPPLLSPSFTNVIQFAEPLHTSLGELMRVIHRLRRCALGSSTVSQVGDLAPCVSTDTLTPLLCLAHLSRRLTAAGTPVTPFVTVNMYRTYVEPLIAVSLRWGLVAEACALLDWFADVLDDHGIQWQRRLHRIVDSVKLDASCKVPVGTLTSLHGREGGLPYFEWVKELRCTSSTALDVLATCHDVKQLRPVCDALLRHRPVEWATEVLQDSFAPFFVLNGLTHLIEALLRVRDAPLARFYVSLLGRLLPRCPCPTQLEVLLRVVHRLATVLTTTHLSVADYAAPDSLYGAALARWQRLKTALEHVSAELFNVDDAGSSSHVGWPEKSTAGLAWDSRRHFQGFCAQGTIEGCCTAGTAQITPRHPAVVAGTVVELCYVPAGSESEGEGLLWLRRTRASTTCPSGGEQRAKGLQLLSLMARCPVGGALRSCAVEMADVMNRNRAQLIRGTASAFGETGRCLGSKGPCDLTTSTGCECQQSSDCGTAPTETDAQQQRQRKESWWCERFELDDRIGRVAASMKDILGAAHILLLGYPSPSLGDQLQALAELFACKCVRLRGASRCPPMDALQHVTLQVLAAAPYLWKNETPSGGQATCWYGPHNARSCACCMQTVKRAQRVLLEAVTALGQLVSAGTAAAAESSLSCVLPSDPGSVEECWTELLADKSVQGVAEEMALSVLSAYYRELTPATATSTPGNGEMHQHHHANLLLVSREHLYLVLDGELHALPWEALDVCQERSISRVPSLEYLKYCSTYAPAVSLQRLFFYRDNEALQHGPSCLTDLIAQHPHWEVDYGETLQAASAAARDGSSAFTAPLMRRLLSQCKVASDRIDAFAYAGHKGGEHLVPRSALYDWIPAAAGTHPTLVLLMGCSSARMKASALYDCFGLPFAYLSAGVSCVLGCLWDVTDADIDRLTHRFLQMASQRTEDGEGITVGECLAVARRACKLRYLTGMATVFYGVNCYVAAAMKDDSKDAT